MSKALAGFGTGSNKTKSAGPLGAAVVAAAQAQAASEAKQQQHQLTAIVNNISSSGRQIDESTASIRQCSPLAIFLKIYFLVCKKKSRSTLTTN